MINRPVEPFWGVALDAPHARTLADFYVRLLGWRVSKPDEPDAEWVTLAPPEGITYLGFQTSPQYQAPIWPPADGQQQQMMHLDFEVADLQAAVGEAVAAGATMAEYQPQSDVVVMLDPVGHPFCLYAKGPAAGSAT